MGGYPHDGMAGGCSSDCFRYMWDGDSMNYVSGGWPSPDACGTTLDSIGVFVQVKHNYMTGFVGESVHLEGHTIMRLEPLPSDECGGMG